MLRGTDRVVRRRLPGLLPEGLEGQVLAGPLVVRDAPAGVLLLIASPRHELRPEHIDLVDALLEPFAVALENDHRLRELVSLREALEADKRSLLSRLGRHDISDSIVGADTGLKPVMDQIDLVARSDTPVLILGETGAGKEVVARAIHERSRRSSGPFLRVNCGAIPVDLVNSELFGHERGSFTGAVGTRQGWFERADAGTLFLDECGELTPAAQVRLLRILQDGTFERVGGERQMHVDVRIVAATHRDLAAMVGDGRFRQDLWYRLAVFPIRLPPLRDRPADIPAMAAHFARRASQAAGDAADGADGRGYQPARQLFLARQRPRAGRRHRARGDPRRRQPARRGPGPGPSAPGRTARRADDQGPRSIRETEVPAGPPRHRHGPTHRGGPGQVRRPDRRALRRRRHADDQSPHAPRPHAQARRRLAGIPARRRGMTGLIPRVRSRAARRRLMRRPGSSDRPPRGPVRCPVSSGPMTFRRGDHFRIFLKEICHLSRRSAGSEVGGDLMNTARPARHRGVARPGEDRRPGGAAAVAGGIGAGSGRWSPCGSTAAWPPGSILPMWCKRRWRMPPRACPTT